MKKNSYKINRLITFRQWSGKSYALFRVIKQTIRIAVLSIVYHGATAKVSDTITVASSDSLKAMKTVELEEISIGASKAPDVYSETARIITVITREQIKTRPAATLSDALRLVTGVDIRQRGPEGIQSDISIRGGTFDQTLILLNGINITDPQTGHHNLNIPVNLNLVSRIEVLEGPASRVYGPNAFSGAINLITSPEESSPLSVYASFGSFNSLSANLSGLWKAGNFNQLVSIGYKKSDGYIVNTDHEVSDYFIHSSGKTKAGKMDFQAGISHKEYGAQAFYTPKYPEQFEATKTFLTSLRFTSQGKVKFSPFIYWRRHSDRFELFRNEAPAWYSSHNYHRSEVFGSGITAWYLHRYGRTTIGSEIRTEGIISNVLGEPMTPHIRVTGEEAFYTKSSFRHGISLFFEHRYRIDKISLAAGFLTQKLSGIRDHWKVYPGADISYQLTANSSIFISGGQSLRLPTFTDLYYSGPSNMGNSSLKPEEVSYGEAGWKGYYQGIQTHTGIYIQTGRNMIDWIRESTEEVWRTTNHTKIIGKGFQATISIKPSNLFKNRIPIYFVALGYNANLQKKNEQNVISYYVLDYIRHKGTMQIEHRLLENLSINWSLLYQDRNGSYTAFNNNEPLEQEYNSFWLLDSKLTYSKGAITANIQVNNIFDHQYFDFGNITQPGRSIRGSITISLNQR